MDLYLGIYLEMNKMLPSFLIDYYGTNSIGND